MGRKDLVNVVSELSSENVRITVNVAAAARPSPFYAHTVDEKVESHMLMWTPPRDTG